MEIGIEMGLGTSSNNACDSSGWAADSVRLLLTKNYTHKLSSRDILNASKCVILKIHNDTGQGQTAKNYFVLYYVRFIIFDLRAGIAAGTS